MGWLLVVFVCIIDSDTMHVDKCDGRYIETMRLMDMNVCVVMIIMIGDNEDDR